MGVKQRQMQRQRKYDDLIKLIGYGLTVEELMKATRKSELHVNKMIKRYRL
jgi:hypothetical protein